MKDYFKNRNEKLLGKLFERQGITISNSVKESDEEPPFNTDPSDVRPTLTGPAMDSDTLNALEGPILQGVRQMIRKGASPQQMESVLRAIDGSILYGFASDSRPYTSPFMGKSIDEIGIPEKTAWQTVEEEDFMEESGGIDDKALDKVTKSLKPSTNVLRTIDDPYEAEDILRHVLKNVRSLVGDKLSNQEIAIALKSILKDVGGSGEATAAEEPTSQAQTQKEVHVLADPDDKE